MRQKVAPVARTGPEANPTQVAGLGLLAGPEADLIVTVLHQGHEAIQGVGAEDGTVATVPGPVPGLAAEVTVGRTAEADLEVFLTVVAEDPEAGHTLTTATIAEVGVIAEVRPTTDHAAMTGGLGVAGHRTAAAIAVTADASGRSYWYSSFSLHRAGHASCRFHCSRNILGRVFVLPLHGHVEPFTMPERTDIAQCSKPLHCMAWMRCLSLYLLSYNKGLLSSHWSTATFEFAR